MEDTLRVNSSLPLPMVSCLNPCFNGRYSQSKGKFGKYRLIYRLNPCFNGRYSQSKGKFGKYRLIYRLNPCFNGRYSQRNKIMKKININIVLIVLMEDTLRVQLFLC